MIFTQDLRSAGNDEERDAPWLVPGGAVGKGVGDFSAEMKNNGNANEVKTEGGIGRPGTPSGTYLSGNEADTEL